MKRFNSAIKHKFKTKTLPYKTSTKGNILKRNCATMGQRKITQQGKKKKTLRITWFLDFVHGSIF
jgi:hypothetical protein